MKTIPTNNQSMLAVIERVAVSPEIDVAKVEALLSMQERIMGHNAKMAYYSAMRDCQSEIPVIAHTADNQQTNSRYTKLEHIHRVAKPIYTKHGFALSFSTESSEKENHLKVVCCCMHIEGHSERFEYELPYDLAGIKGTKNKTEVHASASTVSYAERYLTCMIFNVSTSDDDDAVGGKITEEQIEELENLIKKSKTDREKFLRWLKVEELSEISAGAFKTARQPLMSKLRQADASH